MPEIGARRTASPSCFSAVDEARPRVGELRFRCGHAVARQIEVARRQRAGRHQLLGALGFAPRDRQLILRRAHRRLRPTPRVLERRAPRCGRAARPFAPTGLPRRPPAASTRRARRARSPRCAARSSPEISGPAMIRSRFTVRTFSPADLDGGGRRSGLGLLRLRVAAAHACRRAAAHTPDARILFDPSLIASPANGLRHWRCGDAARDAERKIRQQRHSGAGDLEIPRRLGAVGFGQLQL